MVEFHVDSKTTTIPLGRQGENLARVIYFDLAEMIAEYGEGTATLMNKRVGDDLPYKCTTTQSEDLLAWMPNSTDTAYAGTGKCELRWVVGNVLAKSITYKATITPSITADTDLPAPYQTWYESLLGEISEYTIASADIAKNKSDIAKNKNDISTCKTNIATNTAAITDLNSSLTPVDLIATISFDDRVQADSLRVYKVGRIVMITGGIGAKGNSDIQFTNGQTIASGFPKPTQMAVSMAIPFRTAGTERVSTRTRIAIDGSLAPYWDTVTIPKSGQVLVFNLMYFSET